MIARGTGVIAIAFGAFLFAAPHSPADAATAARSAPAQQRNATATRSGPKVAAKPQRRGRAAARSGGGLQCVPYARSLSGIQISGNAHTWWNQAQGTYARGQRPEPGSVMSFRSTGRMVLGHVAVVSRVVTSREVLIDHANWAGPSMRKGMISRGVSVIDVSPANDWSAVRVGMVGGGYGTTTYPINGFIYARADTPGSGTAFAAATPATPQAGAAAPARASFSGIGTASATARALAGEPVRFEEIAEAQARQGAATSRRRR